MLNKNLQLKEKDSKEKIKEKEKEKILNNNNNIPKLIQIPDIKENKKNKNIITIVEEEEFEATKKALENLCLKNETKFKSKFEENLKYNSNVSSSSNKTNKKMDNSFANNSMRSRNSVKDKSNNNNKSPGLGPGAVPNKKINTDNYNSNFTFTNKDFDCNSINSHIKRPQNPIVPANNINNLNSPSKTGKKDSFKEENSFRNFKLNNLFEKKTYAFILMEMNNFCFTQKEYFKSIYPEINLVVEIEINDCTPSQEKIFFYKEKDSSSNANLYHPYLKKEDIPSNKYRIIKPIEINDEDFPIKININIYTFSNYKLLQIGNEEIFMTLRKEKEMQKYKFYQNIHSKFVNKKVGNLIFNLAYNIEEIYPNKLMNSVAKNFEVLSVSLKL